MKIGQDRHGDWDDKRIFGWICLVTAVVIAVVFQAFDLTTGFLGAATVSFGITAFDKE